MTHLALATIDTFRNRISNVDALTLFRSMPSESVQTIVTSPPYYGLRSYLPDGSDAADLELGKEQTPQEYIARMVEIFREARRVLRDDGTFWLNLGEKFQNGQMLLIPAQTAIALIADGWRLRSDIIWSKTRYMPESVTNRPTQTHEHIFMFSKSDDYYSDMPAIAEPVADSTLKRIRQDIDKQAGSRRANGGRKTNGPIKAVIKQADPGQPLTRNARSVWTIAPASYGGAHFAVMPQKLAERCILAGSRAGDVVCDPFAGSGTTAMVAVQHARQYVGAEINPEYIALADERLSQPIQVSLFSFAGVAA